MNDKNGIFQQSSSAEWWFIREVLVVLAEVAICPVISSVIWRICRAIIWPMVSYICRDLHWLTWLQQQQRLNQAILPVAQTLTRRDMATDSVCSGHWARINHINLAHFSHRAMQMQKKKSIERNDCEWVVWAGRQAFSFFLSFPFFSSWDIEQQPHIFNPLPLPHSLTHS